MTKMVGAAEFKAKCLKLLEEVQATGEPITVTKRGKPVATVTAATGAVATPRKSMFGSMKGTVTWAPGVDPTAPVDVDWEAEWDANNPADLCR